MMKKILLKLARVLTSVSLLVLIVVNLFSVPAGAVVNSTTGPAGNNELYSQSVFPFSVGFVYGDINDDGRYIMSTPVGNWGVEQNQTQNGVDEFDFANILTSNVGDNTDTGSISYEFGDRTYPEVQHYVNDSNGYKYRGGYYDMSLTASVPEFMDNVTSIVFRARDVYYNPVWNNKFFTSDAGFGRKNYLIPTFTLPELADSTTQAFVGSYSVVATIIDGYGESHEVNYSIPIDTRTSGTGPFMFISRDTLAPYVSYSSTNTDIRSSANDTIIISDFTGYLDLQYYEYVVPEPQDELAGTWVFNDTLNAVSQNYSFDIQGTCNYIKQSGSLVPSTFRYIYLVGNSASGYQIGIAPERNNSDTLNMYYVSSGNIKCYYNKMDSLISPNSTSGTSLRTFTITSTIEEVTNGYTLLTWLQANAAKQVSTVTVAEEGTWEPATNSTLASQINVSVPIYDSSQSSSVTPGSSDWRLWSLPVASKYIKTTDLFQVINESISKDYTSWLANATGGFLDAEIFPGFTIGGVMGTLIAFSVVMLFLKLFAGG